MMKRFLASLLILALAAALLPVYAEQEEAAPARYTAITLQAVQPREGPGTGKKLRQIRLDAKVDDAMILETVKKAIAGNPKAVEDYLGGKTKALQAIFGSCMKELRGQGDPQVIREILTQEVEKLR